LYRAACLIHISIALLTCLLNLAVDCMLKLSFIMCTSVCCVSATSTQPVSCSVQEFKYGYGMLGTQLQTACTVATQASAGPSSSCWLQNVILCPTGIYLGQNCCNHLVPYQGPIVRCPSCHIMFRIGTQIGVHSFFPKLQCSLCDLSQLDPRKQPRGLAGMELIGVQMGRLSVPGFLPGMRRSSSAWWNTPGPEQPAVNRTWEAFKPDYPSTTMPVATYLAANTPQLFRHGEQPACVCDAFYVCVCDAFNIYVAAQSGGSRACMQINYCV